MGNLISIRRRIKSAKNISQITKAMEMVSASKMKKAQNQALATRPFTDKLGEIIGHTATHLTSLGHPLTRPNPQATKICIIMVATNKGLCGGLNVNLFREVSNFADNLDRRFTLELITIGKKARTKLLHTDSKLVARFDDLGETATFESTRAISRYLMDAYTQGQYRHIYLAYPKFISTLQNQITIRQVLPISLETKVESTSDYAIEPNPAALIGELVPYAVEMLVFQTILESRASEHSARMVAMKSASDNARELIGNLTLDYNQARQSQVTTELLDVTTARMAIE